MSRPDEYAIAVDAINVTSDLHAEVMHMGGGIEAIEIIHKGVTVMVSGSDAQVFSDDYYYVAVEGSNEEYATTKHADELPELIREAVRHHTTDIDLVAEVLTQQYGLDTEVYHTGGGIWGINVTRYGKEFVVILDGDQLTVTNVSAEYAQSVQDMTHLVDYINWNSSTRF